MGHRIKYWTRLCECLNYLSLWCVLGPRNVGTGCGCCNTCNIIMSHKVCIGMSTSPFTHLANSDISWICPQPTWNESSYSGIVCNTPDVTSDNNPYSAMADSLRGINNHTDASVNLLSPVSSITSLSESGISQSQSDSMTNRLVGSPQAASSPKSVPVSPPQRAPKKDSFKTALMNCRGINNKIAELHTFLSATDPDIVLGTESWLKPNTMNCEIFPENYNIYK